MATEVFEEDIFVVSGGHSIKVTKADAISIARWYGLSSRQNSNWPIFLAPMVGSLAVAAIVIVALLKF